MCIAFSLCEVNATLYHILILYQMHVLQSSFIYRVVLMFKSVEKTYRRALTSTRFKVQPSRAEVTLSKKRKKSNVGHVLTCIFDEIYDNVDVLNKLKTCKSIDIYVTFFCPAANVVKKSYS